ncbi:BON domain-containing protein [Posidoniimonas corsicana]|nr:BON domain-containing protein [Posidoniimonas corsicana]
MPCLASRIQSRIERRLGDRIQGLRVSVDDKHVTLAGRCATYYSKQLAQHAALGVLEDERLENEILVGLLH